MKTSYNTFFISYHGGIVRQLEPALLTYNMNLMVKANSSAWKAFLFRYSIYPFRYAVIDCYYHVGDTAFDEDLMPLAGNKISLCVGSFASVLELLVWFKRPGSPEIYSFQLQRMIEFDKVNPREAQFMQVQFASMVGFYSTKNRAIKALDRL